MVPTGAAKQMTNEVWMDKDGNQCSSKGSFIYEVKNRLLHLDQCFAGDILGGSISTKGDGHASGKFLSGAPKSVAYARVSVTEKRFTHICLTTLDGSPAIHILIVQGKVKDLSVETGIDIAVTPEGNAEDGEAYTFQELSSR